MTYELWSQGTNNIVAEFETEREAQEFIEDMIRADGEDVVRAWVLLREDATDGELYPGAVGDALRCNLWVPAASAKGT